VFAASFAVTGITALATAIIQIYRKRWGSQEIERLRRQLDRLEQNNRSLKNENKLLHKTNMLLDEKVASLSVRKVEVDALITTVTQAIKPAALPGPQGHILADQSTGRPIKRFTRSRRKVTAIGERFSCMSHTLSSS
jgi:hypothetical protein